MNNKEAKIIYKVYKKFYGREPNLSRKNFRNPPKQPNLGRENFRNLTIEIQSMAYILNEYGVSLGAEEFCYQYIDLNMPMSMDIQDILVGKLIGNSDNLNDTSLQLNERAEKIIDIVGSAIKCVINTSQNQIEALREISNILYVKKYVLPSASDAEIMGTTKCTERDLKNVEKLIELIK